MLPRPRRAAGGQVTAAAGPEAVERGDRGPYRARCGPPLLRSAVPPPGDAGQPPWPAAPGVPQPPAAAARGPRAAARLFPLPLPAGQSSPFPSLAVSCCRGYVRPAALPLSLAWAARSASSLLSCAASFSSWAATLRSSAAQARAACSSSFCCCPQLGLLARLVHLGEQRLASGHRVLQAGQEHITGATDRDTDPT